MNINKNKVQWMTLILSVLSFVEVGNASNLISNYAVNNFSQSSTKTNIKFVPNRLIVTYKKGQLSNTLSYQAQSITVSSSSLGKSIQGEEIAVIKLQKNTNMQEAMTSYRSDPNVIAVSYDYIRELSFSPNDPSYAGIPNVMWSLHDTAPDLTNFVDPDFQLPNTADKTVGNDIEAERAWDVWNALNPNDRTSVVVAVIDSGVDYTHPDLVDAMWDGSNATVGGVSSPTVNSGIDAGDDDSDPYPLTADHGTHVSGTIAATANNSIGIPGVASGVKIMALKVGSGPLDLIRDSSIISAINYAVENGAHIINLSLGGKSPENTILTGVVKNAVDAGLLLVIAAGNDGTDNDITVTEIVNGESKIISDWPSSYANHPATKSGVVSVAATDQADLMVFFSNFGKNSVTLGAPGVNIKSTITGIESKPENTASGSAIPTTGLGQPNPKSGIGIYPSCSVAPDTCFDNTFFSNTALVATDCVGSNCLWGWERLKTTPGLELLGDNESINTNLYGNLINGTITSKIINVSIGKKAILTFSAQWDLECNLDYVDVEVFDGNLNKWVLISGADNLFNINEALTQSCFETGIKPSNHTLTGRMGGLFKLFDPNADIPYIPLSFDISAYTSSQLRIRFKFFSDESLNTTKVVTGVRIKDVKIETQVIDYSNSYGYKSGTSMSAPHVAGIAALIKGANPSYIGSQLKVVLLDSGDANASLTGKTVSGSRANAFLAITHDAVAIPVPATPTPENTGGGGGCTLNRSAKFDPLLPSFLILSLIFLFRKRIYMK